MKRTGSGKTVKRSAAMFLALILALTVLTGCRGGEPGGPGQGSGGQGGTESGTGNGTENGTETAAELGAVWSSKEVIGADMLEGSSAGVMGICVHDGSYYVFVTDFDRTDATLVYRVGTDGTVQEEINLELPKDSYPGFFCMDSEGSFYYSVSEWTDLDNAETLLVKADATGAQLWTVPVNEDPSQYFSVFGGAVLEGTGLAVRTEAGLEIFSTEDGSRIRTVDVGSDAAGMVCQLEDGTMLLSGWDEIGSLTVRAVDPETAEIRDYAMPAGMDRLMTAETLEAGPGGTVLFPWDGALYCADPASGTIHRFLDFLASDLDTTQISTLGVMSPDQLLCAAYTSEGMQELLLMDRADPAALAEKTVITLGCAYMEDSVRRQIIAFNRSSDKYRIEVRDYSAAIGEDDNYIETMNNEIITGNVPDILLVGFGLPMDSYIAKGIFEPLDSYLEKDSTYRAEDYLTNVLDIGRVNGSLYLLTPSFYVNALAGKRSVLGDVHGISVEEIRQYMKQYDISADTVFGAGVTQGEFLPAALNANIGDYVDKDTGKANFQSQGFIDLLELTTELPVESDFMDDEDDGEAETMIRDGRALLTEAWLYNFRTFSEMEQATVGEPVAYVGYPSEQKAGPSIENNLQLAMSASSENKEAAWEFLRSFLQEDYQDRVEFGFPVYRRSLDKLAAAAQEKPYYTDENGEKQYYDDVYYVNGQEIIVKPFTPEQTQEIVDFLGSLTNRSELDANILNIVTEETGAFFSGQKSAKDVADTIQSRVQIYLNESR